MRGTRIEGVTVMNSMYVDWSWTKKRQNTDFFDAINEKLDDDCVLEVIKHLDLRHLIYFGQINQRFNDLSKEKMRKINICPLTIGAIDLMNLRYILFLSNDSLQELSISIHCFPTIFGFHSNEKKRSVVETIVYFAGKSLKKVRLHGFDLDENTFFLSYLLTERGILVEEQLDKSNSKLSLNSISNFSKTLQKLYS